MESELWRRLSRGLLRTTKWVKVGEYDRQRHGEERQCVFRSQELLPELTDNASSGIAGSHFDRLLCGKRFLSLSSECDEGAGRGSAGQGRLVSRGALPTAKMFGARCGTVISVLLVK